ncbi:hypothetical protein OROGR_024198 [Orobanche gracilis]
MHGFILQSTMESLLCNEVWLMSPTYNNNNVQENKECIVSELGQTTNNRKDRTDREDLISILIDREATYMPEPGYMKFLKTNDMIRNARFKAVSWIIKAQWRMNLSPGTVFLAVNYLDRFFSLTQCPLQEDQWEYDWTMFELVSISCLSIACKFNETATLSLHEFQVESCVDTCFDPTLIERMELTVLKALGWRMNSTTPFSYVHILTQNIDDVLNKTTLIENLTKRVTKLLLTALLDSEFLEFRQCVMAISAVKCTFGDLFPRTTKNDSLGNLGTSVITLPREDQKDDLIKCQHIMEKKLVRDQETMSACGKNSWHGPSVPVTAVEVDRFNFDDCPVDLSFLVRSGRKRKREILECGI